mgnify:CR=1 FL=1
MTVLGLLSLKFQKNNCLSGQYNTACKRCQKVFSVLAARLAVWWQEGGYGGERIEAAKPPIVITHSPGHMFITDIPNAELNDYLQEKKQSK